MAVFDRIPPQNTEAEQSVLGSMLLDREVIPVVMEHLKSEDFYREDHKEIFDAIQELSEKGEPVDLITVADKLKSRGTLEATGGLAYLSNIASMVPTTANIKYYVEIVQEKSILRKLISTSSEIINMSYEAREEVAVILDRAEQGIFGILQNRTMKGFTHIKDVLVETFNRLEELYGRDNEITGVPTGFSELDRITAGLQNSDFILIAARPSVGKTAFALNIAQYVGIRARIPVAVFNLEMSKEQLVNRILCSEAMVDSHKLRTGRLSEEDWQKIGQTLGPLSEAPIYIDDTAGSSIMDIRSKARRLKLEKKMGLVIIDYLQLIQGRNKENRQQEISDISRQLKILAKELNIPVVALSQLSRSVESRSDKRPILSDLRDSGAIEQDADIVMFLYRDDYYNEDTEKKNIIEVNIAKHRNGSTGTFELVWIPQYTKFGMKSYRSEQG